MKRKENYKLSSRWENERRRPIDRRIDDFYHNMIIASVKICSMKAKDRDGWWRNLDMTKA
jgi:hypothetical protein